MVWIYLAETCTDSTSFRGSEASPKPWKATSDQSPIVKTSDTLKVSSYLEWLQEIYLLLRSGTTLFHFEDQNSQSNPKSSTVFSPAKTLALQDAERVWQESEADYFSRSQGLLARFDRDSCSWRTSQALLITEEFESLESLPPWGMTRDGSLSLLHSLEHLINDRDGSSWPTPMASDWKEVGSIERIAGHWVKKDNQMRPQHKFCHLFGVFPSAQLWEHLQGYPFGWTELSHWAIPFAHNKPEKPLNDSSELKNELPIRTKKSRRT